MKHWNENVPRKGYTTYNSSWSYNS